jgi:7-cyano-7-deazaguanine synthase
VKRALLLSGGLDSLAIAHWVRPELAVTIDYGQLAAAAEIVAATQICRTLGIDHHVVRVDCRALGSGDMAGRSPDALAPASEWWPYRNQLLITLAAMWAVPRDVGQLLIGTVASDGSHADGRAEFIHRINALLGCQEGALQVAAPALAMTTVELLRRARVPQSLLGWAHSCHKAEVACGNCRGCNKYFAVLREMDDELA